MRRALFVSVALVFLVACQDSTVTTPPDASAPQFSILDGSDFATVTCTADDPCWHFFFLSPLVPTPTEFHGDFNPYLRPNVVVTELPSIEVEGVLVPDDSSPYCVVGQEVASFPWGEISVDPIAEMYSVGWQTGGSNLESGTGYRICVRLGTGETATDLGYRDVQPDENGADIPRNPEQQPIMQFNNGSNLPIKFRIETGLFCEADVDCGEASIGAGGGTVVTTSGHAALQVNPTALENEVVVVVQEVSCSSDDFGISYLDINNPQFPGCYDVTTVPELASLGDAGAIVGECYGGPSELQGVAQLHHEMADGTVEALARAEPPEGLECTDYDLMTANATAWDRAMLLARRGWRSVQTNVSPWFSPAPLLASHHGFGGGELDDFSPVSWAIPASMELVGQNEFEGTLGEIITPQVLVTRITEDHPNIPSDQPPLAGASVDWAVTSTNGVIVTDEGDVTDLEVGTGSDGIAEVSWKLGGGWNTLTASGYGIGCTSYTYCDVGDLDPRPDPGPFPPDHHVEGAVDLGTGTITFTAFVPVPMEFTSQPVDVYMDETGIAVLSEVQVCTVGDVVGEYPVTLVAVNNNGSWVELALAGDAFDPGQEFPIPTDSDGCLTFTWDEFAEFDTSLEINKTGAYRLVVNPDFNDKGKVVGGDAESLKFNVKPYKK